MKSSEGQVDIYLSLDEVLDTVAGTLHLVDPEAAVRIIGDDYHQRKSDIFPGIDKRVFRERYEQRDADTLQVSCITNIYKLVRRLSDGVASQMVERPYYKSARIVVNCHPYNIAEDVKEEMLKALNVWFGDNLPIVLVDWPVSVLTPEKCKKEFGVLIMYNPESWLNYHMLALEHNPMPEVMMLTPQIHHILEPTKEQMDQLLTQGAAPFLAFEMLMRPLVSVDVIEVEYFSIIKQDGI